jgi:pimeloyl-ACP methyl ester carboxylesterase
MKLRMSTSRGNARYLVNRHVLIGGRILQGYLTTGNEIFCTEPISPICEAHPLIKNSTIAFIDKCGHTAWLEQPEQTWKNR